jgi:flagellar hook-basal body complex protein FliE
MSIELLSGVTQIGNQGIGSTSITRNEPSIGKSDNAGGASSFADLFREKLAETSELIQNADRSAEELIAGRNKDLHGAMISLEKADVSFRMLMGVRNKMLEAYREIMRMQV